MRKTIVGTLLLITSGVIFAAELTQQFNSPAFSGVGYSSHALTIYQIESARKQKLADDAKAAADQAARDAKNTNLAKFLVNVESRIYAQLSKQLADAMFAECTGSSCNTGTMNFQDTKITWTKDAVAGTVQLDIIAPSGTTQVVVPLASFSF